jgi:hypothetical protein
VFNGALSVSLQYGIENKFQQRKLNVQKGSTGSILATLGPPLMARCVGLQVFVFIRGGINGRVKYWFRF